ncbi:uncharacterized protein [Aegilops tauschii subsp. strangulata]|uniref:Uncharacterized protein n=1 Tax=Aegilops tauschii TaxID=37682 RepID=M8D8S5_AEGTA
MRSSLALLLLFGAAIAPILTTGVSPAVNTSVLSPGPTPGSANDTLQRGIIATNQIAHNVTATLGIISDLVRDLNTCTRLYMTMATKVAAALDDLHAGRVDNAADELTDTVGAPIDCDMVLMGIGEIEKVPRDPIESENDENDRLIQLAIDILDPPSS